MTGIESMTHLALIVLALSAGCQSFAPNMQSLAFLRHDVHLFSTSTLGNDDDDDEEEEDIDAYRETASSEFLDGESKKSDLVASSDVVTNMDWGGALGKLRQRVEDVESGSAGNPSHALFRLMSSESPNQAIGNFVQSANPQVVQAMSGAISSLLGGLSNPVMGTEMLVKASGDKIGSLCFQLQMTGYMFRNAEYVIALKEILQLKGQVSLNDYKQAFKDLDKDGSGFIETSEVKELLDGIYDEQSPAYEVETFMRFFDTNQDGRISWEEFERGLGVAMSQQNPLSTPSAVDDDEYVPEPEPEVAGTVQIEMEDGSVVEVEAKEYIKALKMEAIELKKAINAEQFGVSQSDGENAGGIPGDAAGAAFGGITGYIASRQGDIKSLTAGISPEIVDTMKKLVAFVLEGGESGQGKNVPTEQMEMEIPGTALQQLALWQLILGYRLREAEATGDYLKLLD